MSQRRVVTAIESFSSPTVDEQVGKNPRVVRAGLNAGVIQQGTELWSDDPIVLAHSKYFVDAEVVPRSGAPIP